MGEEVDNLRGLISLLADDDPSIAQQLAWSIGQYHDLLQSYRHGIEEVARHVAQLDAPTSSRVGLLTLLADLRLRVGEIDLAATRRWPMRGHCDTKSDHHRGTRSRSSAQKASSH